MAIRLIGEVAKDRHRFLMRFAPAMADNKLPGAVACVWGRPMVLAIHPWVSYETLNLVRKFKWLSQCCRVS